MANEGGCAKATPCGAGARWLNVSDRRHFNLETAVGRARAGRDAVRWQGATMQRAHAGKEEQRRQSAAAWLARVCSALTHEVMNIVGGNVCLHAVSPAE